MTDVIKKTNDGLITSPEFRMAWPRLFKAEAFMRNGKPVGDPVYSMLMLMPMDAPATTGVNTLADMQRKALGVAQVKWPGRDLRADIGAGKFNWPFVPGVKAVAKAQAKGNDGAPYEGMMTLKTSSKFKPQVIGPDKATILNEDTIYSGAWGYAEINFVAYDGVNNGPDGVKGYLNFVMKSRDDERIFGRTAEQAFAGISGGVSQVDPTAGMDDEIPF